MRKHLVCLIAVMALLSLPLVGKVRKIDGFTYTLRTVDKSPKAALQQAEREAIIECLKQNGVTYVYTLTAVEETERNRQISEFVGQYVGVLSKSAVRKWRHRQNPEQSIEDGGVIRTTVVMDIEFDDADSGLSDFRINAGMNKNDFFDRDLAVLTYRGSEPLHYMIATIQKDSLDILWVSNGKVPARQEFSFPAAGDDFTLSMELPARETHEYGAFCVIGSTKPFRVFINEHRQIKAGVIQTERVSVDRFFATIDWKYTQIEFLPYLIRRK